MHDLKKRWRNHVITEDETWIHHAEPETKEQSRQWKRFVPLHQILFKHAQSVWKSHGYHFWNYIGIILINDVPKGHTVSCKVLYVLPDLLTNFKAKWAKFIKYNAPIHTVVLTTEFFCSWQDRQSCNIHPLAMIWPPVTINSSTVLRNCG